MTADPIGRELVARLKRAGATAVLLDLAADTRGHDLLLHLEIRGRGRPSILAGFNWRCRARSQPLAATLVSSVAAASGLPGRGTRLFLGGGEGAAVRLTITVGRNPSAEMVVRLLDGIYAGLIRHWALTAPLELLLGPVPEAAAAAEETVPAASTADPPPPDPVPSEPAAIAPPDEPRIMLYPDPSVVFSHDSADLDPRARLTAVAGNVTPAAPVPVQTPEPARPAPTSAYPILVTKVSNPRANLVIRGRNTYYDPLHPPGSSVTIPFAWESAPEPMPDDTAIPSPVVTLQVPSDVLPAPADEVEPAPVPVVPDLVAQAHTLRPAPPDPVQITSPKNPRPVVRVIQHSSGGTVIRLS